MLRLLTLLLPALWARAIILRRWPLASTLPVDDLTRDGTSAGPAGASNCVGENGSSLCHDPDKSCNQCRSHDPHIFHVTWCASTEGFGGISCDIDLGYRSAQGARYGILEYSLRGFASAGGGGGGFNTSGDGDRGFTNASTVTFPDSPFAFSHFALPSGKNDILTVYQLSQVEGSTAGDDLPLTATSGFCCRATFWGGKTDTGTLYIGDLTIRANRVMTPAAAPSGPPPGFYSGGTLGGAVVASGLAGAVAAAAAQVLLLPRLARLLAAARGGGGGAGALSAFLGASSTSSAESEGRGLLAAARVKQLAV